jgi:hypothetical protein
MTASQTGHPTTPPPSADPQQWDPGLPVFPLHVQCKALEPVALPAFAGSAIRGALFGAVRELACVNQAAPSCSACPLHSVCGVSRLLATVEDDGPRGGDAPRPFAIRPPENGGRVVRPGEEFSFRITLIGTEALQLFPYIALGLRRMGERGLGRALPQRGRFAVECVVNRSAHSGVRFDVLRSDDELVTLPAIEETLPGMRISASRYTGLCRVTLHLRTPLRLTANKALVTRLAFEPLMRRIFRRTTDLALSFGAGVPPLDFRPLLERAAAIRLVEDRTRWLELESRSARQGRHMPIGGLIGSATFDGELDPFLPWLLWAEAVGVGKDVTKGNGALDVDPEGGRLAE